jgi:hypothetical protein
MDPRSANDLYRFAGYDLSAFVERWLHEIAEADPVVYPAARHLRGETSPKERASSIEMLTRQFIAPRVWGDAGTDEELVLFAVICYPRRRSRDWAEPREFVREAFVRAHEIGPEEIARDLRDDVLRRSRPDVDDPGIIEYRESLRRSMNHDPARIAAHDQNMAQGDQRALRAARLLDPAGEEAFWQALLYGS